MAFPVVMYGCESWTMKKAERQRIDAFELWCWRRLLRAPWTARRSNQSILKEINPGCSLEGLMLKLKLQYFGHLMWRVDSLEKTDAGSDWGQKEKEMTEDEMVGWHQRLNEHEFEWTPGVGDGEGGLACCDSWGHKESDTTERLNWTEMNHLSSFLKAQRTSHPSPLPMFPLRVPNQYSYSSITDDSPPACALWFHCYSLNLKHHLQTKQLHLISASFPTLPCTPNFLMVYISCNIAKGMIFPE